MLGDFMRDLPVIHRLWLGFLLRHVNPCDKATLQCSLSQCTLPRFKTYLRIYATPGRDPPGQSFRVEQMAQEDEDFWDEQPLALVPSWYWSVVVADQGPDDWNTCVTESEKDACSSLVNIDPE